MLQAARIISAFVFFVTIFACSHEKAERAIFVSGVDDTSLEWVSATRGRPANLENDLKLANLDLASRIHTAFASEDTCHGISLVTSNRNLRAVPAFYLDVAFWRGPDALSAPEWQWSMNGSTFIGKASSVEQLARDVCSIVNRRGADVRDR